MQVWLLKDRACGWSHQARQLYRRVLGQTQSHPRSAHWCFWEHLLWRPGTEDWQGGSVFSLLWRSTNLNVTVCFPTTAFACSILSMRECPRTPAPRFCTSYWQNNGSSPLPTCSSRWPEEPRTSTWSLVSRTCFAEVLSKWPRPQVSLRGGGNECVHVC